MTRMYKTLIVMGLALAAALSAAQPALAHTRVEVGPYVIIFGWETEPVIVGERNGIVMEVTREGEPVLGLESTLNVELRYAGRVFLANVVPGREPGTYVFELIPTVRGQYEVVLNGMIEDDVVSELVAEPEEVGPASVLQFPERVEDAYTTQSAVEDLQAELAQTRTWAMAASGVAVVALALGVVGLFRSKKSS